MGFLSKFEGKMEDTVEGAAELMGGSKISPVQIAKKAEKQMRREKIVGAGKQYAPTLYTVLISKEDDSRLFNYYPTLAGETETYLMGKAAELGLVMDGQPLVRFIADPELKRGKFDVVAEMVASSIVSKLRNEEMARYGLATNAAPGGNMQHARPQAKAIGGATARPANPVKHSAQRGAHASYSFDDDAEPEMLSHNPVSGVINQIKPVNTAFSDENPYTDEPVTAPAAQGEVSANRYAMPNYDVYLYDEARDVAYVLDGQYQSIGRESNNDIVVPDINVSRSHATIHIEPTGTWVITDTGSTNGVYVNGRKVESAPLRDADMIRIGTTELEFQLLS